MLVPLDLLPSVCQVVVHLGLAASVFLLDVRARVCKSSLPVPAAAGLALRLNWLPLPAMDKSGANYASLANINLLLILAYVDHSGKSSSVAIIGGL